MCSICKQFLTDFLETGLPKGLPMAALMRLKKLPSVLPDLVQWYVSLSEKVPQRDFDEAMNTASRIARRGRGALEYEILTHTSAFNLLAHKFPWIRSDLEFLKVLLLEAGVFEQKKDWRWSLTMAQGYLVYNTPRTLAFLHEVHSDHSKGDARITAWKRDDEVSFADEDDYQKEVLLEVDLSDLYD